MKFKSLALAIIATGLFATPAWSYDPATGATTEAEGITPIKVTGDVRYRQEQSPVTPEEGERTRLRHRMRARVKIEGRVNEQATAGVRIVTGDPDAVRSTNRTLGDSSSYDPVLFDLYYFAWNFENGLVLTGGKIANPYYRPGKQQLIWDNDVTLEGMAFVYNKPEDGGLFARIGAYYMRENGNDVDQGLYSWQVGYGLGLGSGDLKVAFAQYHFDLLAGNQAIAGSASGNTVEDESTVEGGNYTKSYNPYELSFNWSQNLGSAPFSFFGAYIYNSHTEEENQGYLVGFALSPNEDSPLSFKYNYRDLEADATVGSLTESDFGRGQTDVKGSTVALGYDLAQNTSIGFAYYMYETAAHTDDPVEGDTYQLDFAVKF